MCWSMLVATMAKISSLASAAATTASGRAPGPHRRSLCLRQQTFKDAILKHHLLPRRHYGEQQVRVVRILALSIVYRSVASNLDL